MIPMYLFSFRNIYQFDRPTSYLHIVHSVLSILLTKGERPEKYRDKWCKIQHNLTELRRVETQWSKLADLAAAVQPHSINGLNVLTQYYVVCT